MPAYHRHTAACGARAQIMTDLPAILAPVELSQALLAMLQTSGALVSLKETDSGRYLWANERWIEFFAAHAVEGAMPLLGATDLDMLPPADAAAVRAADQRACQAGLPVVGEHRFERVGRRVEIRTLRHVLPGAAGRSLLISLWWDDTPARRAAEQLTSALAQVERQQAALDQMVRQRHEGADRPTELFRQEQFEEHLRREWALSTREHREFALVLLSIDTLPDVLGRQGETAAELLPKAVAHILRTSTRAMDVLSHVAEGRLAVLLSGVGLATAHTRMEQIRRQCATHLVVHQGAPVPLAVSVGIASFPHTADTLDGLSRAAESALGQARLRGGNRVVLAAISLKQAVAGAGAAGDSTA